MHGAFLSPGWALWHLARVVDPVPRAQCARTPLFRDPRTNAILTVAGIRSWLRLCIGALGRDASVFGAHSLRIGGATAMAWLGAPPEAVMHSGRWRSDAYMAYIRQCRAQAETYVARIASADTDDYQSDFVDIDAHAFGADDEE